MFTRILGGVALVLAGSAMTLAATPYLPRGGARDQAPVASAAQGGEARCDLPPGHPPIDACAPSSGEDRALPPGHPPVGHHALPPGHPPIDRLPGHVPMAPPLLDDGAFPQGFVTHT
jgi:hypothetical protein